MSIFAVNPLCREVLRDPAFRVAMQSERRKRIGADEDKDPTRDAVPNLQRGIPRRYCDRKDLALQTARFLNRKILTSR